MTRIACLSILACLILAAVAPAQVPDLATLDLIERATPAGPVALVDGQPISQEEFLRQKDYVEALLAESAG